MKVHIKLFVNFNKIHMSYTINRQTFLILNKNKVNNKPYFKKTVLYNKKGSCKAILQRSL